MGIRDFKFSDLWYFGVLKTLREWLRSYAPEITDENAYEPFEQLTRSIAIEKHGSGLHIDVTAREVYPITCRLQRSLEQHAEANGYSLVGPSSAIGEIAGKLAADYTASTQVITEGDQFATEASAAEPAVTFSATEDVTVATTSILTHIFSYRQSAWLGNFRVQNDIDGTYYSPWTAGTLQNDAIYFGNAYIMTTGLTVTMESASPVPSGYVGVWEYYQGSYDTYYPAEVLVTGRLLEFDLTPLFGTTSHAGATVRIHHLSSANFHTGACVWIDGKNKLIDCSYLGQATPSTEITDYAIGSLWQPLEETDGTNGLTVAGDVTWDLPMTLDRAWQKGTVNSIEGLWVRFRVTGITNAAQVLPSFNQVIPTGPKWVLFGAEQGVKVVEERLGVGDGTPLQEFQLANDDAFPESIEISYSGQEYTRVPDLSTSTEDDYVFRYKAGEFGGAYVQFGTGVNGVRPPTSLNQILATYRHGSDLDGNVGSGKVLSSRTSGVTESTNQRPMRGWGPREGSSLANWEIDRQRVIAGRTAPTGVDGKKGVYSSDQINFAVENYKTSTGTKPIARAAIVRWTNDDTIMVAVVPKGSGTDISNCSTNVLSEKLGQGTIDAIEQSLNGDEITGVGGLLRFGGRVRVQNYIPKLIAVEMDIAVTEIIPQITLEQRFLSFLNPLAVDKSGMYRWRFADTNTVTRGFLESIAYTFDVVRQIDDRDELRVNSGTGDIELNWYEMPVLDVANSTWRQRVINA